MDLTIEKVNIQHQFKIYRKLTQLDQTIHATSNHPTSHKLVAFNSLIYRLRNTLKIHIDFQDEFNILKHKKWIQLTSIIDILL